ncbi:DUF1613-domain-containing protein [Hesseltinella vesiculosa]|uniref:tRNA (uracil-O(2)-)-methyltransferase n=1 Tax=Hesseltinella vesiculosa TaxID=101127 RepID=A0A1X2GBG9_9FUNG|nr:DUF1613-domain-containing protein [Hesseltinella vesiculosa]
MMITDPSDLFSQYEPSIYFDEPAIDSKTSWLVLCEQTVPADRSHFWSTIRRWTVEPHLVIPPIDKAKVTGTQQTVSHDGDVPFESIQRDLIPKRKTKDTLFQENVLYFEQTDGNGDMESRVEYHPQLQENQPLPFYYPKVQAYGFTYRSKALEKDSGMLRLVIKPLEDATKAALDQKMRQGLEAIFHRLFKWCIQARLGYKKKAHHDSLVPKEVYEATYHRIKSKYAEHLVLTWPEKTDPKKFVYEDLAIASYLICLWEAEEALTKRKPTFVDLGCGNGLLTYLLTLEGYEGYGIDIADRKIWTHLCDNRPNMLQVQALQPDKVTYAADWLIGNHADELVPWIPIIAAKSGNDCKFMVIPCCFYGLDGTKSLSLKGDQGGKYRAYTNYIKEIIQRCGFEDEEDYLRIPSTKNIALVGRSRRTLVDMPTLVSLSQPGQQFLPRKTDREKEEQRRLDNENKNRPKLA